MSPMSATPGTPATSRRSYHPPTLLRLGSLAQATLAGSGTIAETNPFYTMGAPTCANPMGGMATNMVKYPCG